MKKNFGDRKLSEFSVARAYFNILCSFIGIGFIFPFILTVIGKFFLLQYFEKIHLFKIPVKNVDHELDSRVPFREDLSPVYMDFINYWIRPLSMLIKKFGHFKGLHLCREFVTALRKTYSSAYSLYRISLTTTVRPKPKTKQVKAIQKVDPHYCCVPSLHIAIIVLTISFYRMLFEREDFTTNERENWNRELYEKGIAIAESVLYMKQHSVNCIPAAIYMMTKITPELMNEELAKKMISDLFTNAPDVKKEDGEKIRAYIRQFYSNLLSESSHCKDWTKPILDWLESYEPFRNE